MVIAGLRSQDDARSVQELLSVRDGVRAADVNTANRVALVRHSDAVTVADLIKAVEAAGFHARRAVPGEGSADYASSPWGTLRQGGLTPQGEMVLYRALAVLGGLLITAMVAAHLGLRSDHRSFMQLVLGTVAQCIIGWRFYLRGWRALLHRQLDQDLFVALATTAVWLISAANALTDPDGARTFFVETGVMLTVVCVGRWFELGLRLRSGRNMRDLVEMAPLSARALRGGREEDVLSCDLVPGELVVVRPGERFPADGMVVEGRSAADESLLTGEALPVPKHPGSPVLGGTVNGHGHIVFRVGRVAGETALARMVQMVSDAEHTRPAVSRTAGRLAAAVGVVAVIAALASVVVCYAWPVAHHREAAVLRLAAVLACASPWAILLAVPNAVAAALGRAARLGILLRSARAIEQCAGVKAVVLDLGGTVTLGQPELIESRVAPGCSEVEMLELAGGLTAHSPYPLDVAIAAAARAQGVATRDMLDFSRVPGRGVRGRTAEGEILLGSRRFMDEQGVYLGELADYGERQESNGRRVVLLAQTGRAIGLFVFEDPLQPGAQHTAERLQEMGIPVWLISGGTTAMAKATARQAGIPEAHVIAEVPHDERPARIRQLSREAGPLAMVGDPDRDGPALVEADVGMAIGCGAQTSAAGAEILLVGNDLRGALRAVRMSGRTLGNIRLSLAFACLYNVVAIGLAVTGLLRPEYAAAGMVLATLLVALNAYRLSLRPAAVQHIEPSSED